MIIATPTSSGKSLVFLVPVLEVALCNPHAVSLLLYPTKALAQDQLRAIGSYTGTGLTDQVRRRCRSERSARQIVAAVVDGDSSDAQREHARRHAALVLTNPDMLHHTLLRGHARWRRVLAQLRFVVLDEAHTYTGAFGSHVALVMRRLVRVCRYYGNSSVQFICCSATLADAAAFFNQLLPRCVDPDAGSTLTCAASGTRDWSWSPRTARRRASGWWCSGTQHSGGWHVPAWPCRARARYSTTRHARSTGNACTSTPGRVCSQAARRRRSGASGSGPGCTRVGQQAHELVGDPRHFRVATPHQGIRHTGQMLLAALVKMNIKTLAFCKVDWSHVALR